MKARLFRKKAYLSFRQNSEKLIHFFIWVIISILIGAVVGIVGTGFALAMELATSTRMEKPWLILGLPIGGLIIVFLYHVAHRENDKGTNVVLSAIRSEDSLNIMSAPLIFISTVITHLFGGSAGREGAALILGGSIGDGFAKLFKTNKTDSHVMIMCGMSACFSALFGTPMAAAIFPLEVVCVGEMYYSALVPCAISSIIATNIAQFFGVQSEAMHIMEIPKITPVVGIKILFLAILCAGVSAFFCIVLHEVSDNAKKYIPNPYYRVVAAGAIVAILTGILHTTDYMGAGMNVIERCMEGEVRPEAFLLKILFTAIALGCGFKGGEIVPSFFIGATFGCLVGHIIGLSPSMCAATGMIAVFCGVTNCPISSLFIALELFGMEGAPYFLIAIAVSYMLSGYYSLYNTQKFIHSKLRAMPRDEQSEAYHGRKNTKKHNIHDI